MNLQRFRAQKVAVKYGLLLGFTFFIINCVLTFVPLDATMHTIVSYATVPFIIFFSYVSGFLRMRKTNNLEYAIQSSILTVSLGLLLGFGSLFFLTFSFLDVVRNNPVTLQNFQTSGQSDLDNFIRESVIYSATTSVPVSIVLGIFSGMIGASVSKRSKS